MINKSLIDEIANVDWSEFNGPSMYRAEVVSSAICSLLELDDSNKAEEVGNNLINALGNNHSGTYYPVVLKALDYVIAIVKSTDSKACRVCALGVLNDLYYFEPDVEGYGDCLAGDLKKIVQEKLSPFSDESIEL